MQVYSLRFSLWAVARRQATEKASVEFMLWKPFVRGCMASGKGSTYSHATSTHAT